VKHEHYVTFGGWFSCITSYVRSLQDLAQQHRHSGQPGPAPNVEVKVQVFPLSSQPGQYPPQQQARIRHLSGQPSGQARFGAGAAPHHGECVDAAVLLLVHVIVWKRVLLF
jgi:hypothetical protein